MSGYAEEAFSKNLPSQEQYAFLAKPFTLKQLVAEVKKDAGAVTGRYTRPVSAKMSTTINTTPTMPDGP